MSLPAWMEDCKHGKGYLKVFKALSIAWEALEDIRDNNSADTVIKVMKAMRRISEMGGPVESHCTCYGPQGWGHAPTCAKEKRRK